jgi:hypothetical protein
MPVTSYQLPVTLPSAFGFQLVACSLKLATVFNYHIIILSHYHIMPSPLR